MPLLKYSYWANNPSEGPRAEYLVQMLRRSLGVEVELDPVENTTLASLMQSPDTMPQMVPGGWCADYPDPQNWLSVFWHSSANFAANVGYANEEADELMNQADAETDPDMRMDLYAEAQDLIIGDAPAIITGNNRNVFLVKPSVQGLEFTPQGIVVAGMRGVTLEP